MTKNINFVSLAIALQQLSGLAQDKNVTGSRPNIILQISDGTSPFIKKIVIY